MTDEGRPAWVDDELSPFESRFVTIDYPGFGLSSARPGYRYLPEEHAEVVVAFLDHLGLSDATLVAHDWGGPIGLSAVEQRPTVFTGLVLGRLLIKRFNLVVNAFIPTGHRLRKPSAADMTHYRKALATLDRREAAAVLPGRITASRAFLGEVEARLADLASLPTLILWGAGHFVQSDAPEAFAAAIRDWRR